jgi:hypothetical protein
VVHRSLIFNLLVFATGVINVVTAVIAAPGERKMKTFTIENETNNITLHPTIQEAEAVANAGCLRNEAGLAKLAANWPAAQLVDVWNSLPGASPVKKFTGRRTAISRIWRAIQRLEATVSRAETTQEPKVSGDRDGAGIRDRTSASRYPGDGRDRTRRIRS